MDDARTMSDNDKTKVPLGDLLDAQKVAEDTMRHNEARRQGRRLFDLEQRLENVIATIDVQQEALRQLIDARDLDRGQIERLMGAIADLRGELASVKAELWMVKRDIALVNESLGGLIE